MGMTQGPDRSGYTTLSEINVTPLVDVMLVLLTIFMVASSVETIQVQAEHDKMIRERSAEEEQLLLAQRLESLQRQEEDFALAEQRDRRSREQVVTQEERMKELEEQLLDSSQNVPIELPKTNSEAVNLSEQKKIVLSFTAERDLYVGDTRIISCKDPMYIEQAKAKLADRVGSKSESMLEQASYDECLAAIETKLTSNVKLQEDGECYLRADRKLDYGAVLSLMATIRKAGITKFGLVAEELE